MLPMDSLYIQSRTVAPDPDSAAQVVYEKLEQQGYRVERLVMFPCPMQPYNNRVWVEFLARVEVEARRLEW
jgi:hypothetical protein